MSSVVQAGRSWRLVLDTAEHARLVALDEQAGRLVASSVVDDLGLGRFVPVDTTGDGDPAPNTDWFTAHRHHDNITNLAAAVDDLLAPGNAAAMQALTAQVRDSLDDTGPALTVTEIADLFNTAAGRP